MAVVEGVLCSASFSEVMGIDIKTAAAADDLASMQWNAYGSDKPDTRFGMDVREFERQARGLPALRCSTARAEAGGRLCAASTPRVWPAMSRKEIDSFGRICQDLSREGSCLDMTLTADGNGNLLASTSS